MEEIFEIEKVELGRTNLKVFAFDMKQQKDFVELIPIDEVLAKLGGEQGQIDVTITYTGYDEDSGPYPDECQILLSIYEFFKDIFGDNNDPKIPEHDQSNYKQAVYAAIIEILTKKYYPKN